MLSIEEEKELSDAIERFEFKRIKGNFFVRTVKCIFGKLWILKMFISMNIRRK